MTLTARQVRELNLAVRHLGRAMKALERAGIPPARDFQTTLYRLNNGIDLTAKASDALIDGLESQSEGSDS